MKYSGDYLKEISFPLGGIGTGCIGLGGDGRLIDWEIFNRPSKGSINKYSHFAIRALSSDGSVTAAVLNGDMNKDYIGQRKNSLTHVGYGLGPDSEKLCGLPHFKYTEFDGSFPMSALSFKDDLFPAKVMMTAFNPFIPSDDKNSSIPAAFFEFEVKNITDKKIKYQIAFSVSNPYEVSVNKAKKEKGYSILTLSNAKDNNEDVNYGDLTVATDCKNTYTQAYWYRGGWKDSIVSFWNEFAGGKELKERSYDDVGKYDTGTLIAEIEVEPKSTGKIKFVLSWNAPNCYNYWRNENTEQPSKQWKNYYAVLFENSVSSAVYSLDNWNYLYDNTLLFKNALHDTTMPAEVIDAASSNLSVLKSPTVLRLEDGSFYGWEGVLEKAGSCEGTCQHVWNYAYALCFLFPKLERSIRDLEFKYSTEANGRMQIRMTLPVGSKMNDFRACVDGQMGSVIKCYREWKISGDNEWLKNNWHNITKILDYAWSDENEDCWDRDKDGILEGRQHHTLDMELFGPSSWLEGFYLAALKAGAKMAEFLGDTKKASEYTELFEKGYKWTKENLFNGKYFVQKINLSDKSITDKFNASDSYWNDEKGQIKYQICDGSSIDQLLAQWHSDIIGLGQIFDSDQISSALSEMMNNNYIPCMRYFTNPWRIFSLNDEAGTVICAYPNPENKPEIPIPYCEETMTGFEYSFAGLLFAHGRIDDGIKVVKAVRDRFDGKKRNPWNEFECGSNYARSMASYAIIPILSGFDFDMPNKHIGFNPYITEDFKSIFSVANAWGTFTIKNNTVSILIHGGQLKLTSIGLPFVKNIKSMKSDGKNISFAFENGNLIFDETVINNCVEIKL